VVDWVRRGQQKTELSTHRFIGWLGLPTSKFYDWQARYGKANEHNGWIPRDFWLEAWEKRAILDFHRRYPLEGYRHLTFMMLDADIVAVSPASVWRVLHARSSSASKGSAFAPACLCRPRMRGAWWVATWSTTTRSACTALSAT